MKITLAIPSHDAVPFGFAYDLAALCAYTAAKVPEDVEFGINAVTGTYVHKARQELAEACLEQKADWVLWLDSDMRFPRDMLFRLLSHQKPLVGINYSTRGIPSRFVAIKKVAIKGERLRTEDDSTGLEEVEGIGFGAVLMSTAVLKALPDPLEVPWFKNDYMGEGHWMGEDVWFCKLAREAGFSVFVDHDLSKRCAHIGSFEFRTEHATIENEIAAELAAA